MGILDEGKIQTCEMGLKDWSVCLWIASVKPVLLTRRLCAVGVLILETFG